MKRGIIVILLLSLINSIYSQKHHNSTPNYREVIGNMEQSMDYKRLIHFVDSLQLNEDYALKSKASAQISLGLVNDAIFTINTALILYPQNINLLSDFSEMTFSIGNEDLTLNILNITTGVKPVPRLMSRKAEIYYSQKRYKQSLAVSDSILSQFSIPSVIRLKARNLAALNDISNSQKLLETQFANDKNDFLTFRQLANLLLAVDSINKLIKITDDYLQNDSLNTEILSLNSKANYLNNNFKKAANGYKRLLPMGVQLTYDQCFFTAMSFYRASDSLIYDALNYMLKADSLADGKRYPIKYYLGQMAEKTGKTSEAIKYYMEASTIIQPDTNQLALVFNKTGKMQMLSKKPLEAIESHKKALRYKSDDTTAILSLGLAYSYLNEYEKALEYFEEIIRLLPDTVNDAYSNLAERKIQYLKEKLKNKQSHKTK